MKTDSASFDKQIYYRLIALWVLCEGVLGGMMHAVKIPFTGIVVSSAAVICISLIAYYVPIKGAILRATIIVAIFKMMISPHTPPTAYIAVFFQGMMGQLLFYNPRFFRLSCILLAVFALVESAIQRILVLSFLYGNNFWKAMNDFVSNLAGKTSATNYSMAVAMGYLMMHVFIGMIVGVFAGSIVWQSTSWSILHEEYMIPVASENTTPVTSEGKKKRKIKYLFVFIWMLLTALFIQSYFHIGRSILPANTLLQIILRSLLVVLTWYFLINPLISALIKKWLAREQVRSVSDINQVALLLPSTKYIFLKSWELSAAAKGWKRLSVFCKIVLVNTLR